MSDDDGPLLRILKKKTNILNIKKPPRDITKKADDKKKMYAMENIPTLYLDGGSFDRIVDRR